MGNPRNDYVRIRENAPFVINILRNDEVDPGQYPTMALYDWMTLDDQFNIVGTMPFDYLAQGQEAGTVVYYRLTDGTTQSSNLALVLITLVGRNDAPVFADPGALIVGDHAPTGSIVARLRATDVDTGARLTYSLIDDGDGAFTIDSLTGLLTIADGSALTLGGAVGIRALVVDEFGARDTLDLDFSVVPSIYPDADQRVVRSTSAPVALYGQDGDDWLVDRFGTALMAGGRGDDTYSVTRDPTAEDRSLIGEKADEGIDKMIFTGGRFVLPDNIETLVYRPTGTRDQSFVKGNALDNLIVTKGQATVESGLGNDRIVGSAFDDALRGGDGDDELFSGGGRDLLDGGRGDDIIRADNARIYGGDGADRFVFRDGESVAEIYDYAPTHGDLIVLTGIDANTLTAPNDRFRFIGTQAFSGVAGQLRYVVDVIGEATFVLGDVNGDAIADFVLTLPVVQTMQADAFLL